MGQREREQGETGGIAPIGRGHSSARSTAAPASQLLPFMQASVRSLKLSPATNHALERFGHSTIGQIIDLSDAELLQNPYLTPQGVAETRRALGQFAHQPATPAVSSEMKSRPGPTDELVSRPVFPCTDWDQETIAPETSTLSATAPGTTAEPATSRSSVPYTVRELGLSSATTQALEHFGQWRVKQLQGLSDEALSQNPYITAAGVTEVRLALQRLTELSLRPGTLADVDSESPSAPESAPNPPRSPRTSYSVPDPGLSIDFIDPDTGEVSRCCAERDSTGVLILTQEASTSLSAAAAHITKGLEETSSPSDPLTPILPAQSSLMTPADDPLPVPVQELGFSEQTVLALNEHGIFTLGHFADSARWEVPFLKSLDSRIAVEVWEALTFLSRISSAIVADLDATNDETPAQWRKATSDTPLEALSLSKRCHNALVRAGYECIEQVLDLDDDELLEVRNLGRQSLADLRQALDSYVADHPDQGRARVMDTSFLLKAHPRWKAFRPTHSPLTQTEERTWLMLLESGQTWDSVKALDQDLRARRLPSLVPLPAETIVGRETVSFLLRMGCPLAEIPSDRLTISKPARDQLQRTGHTTVLRVFLADRIQLQQSLAAETFETLVSDIDYYVQWLAAQYDWSAEVQRRQPSPTAFFHLAREDWEDLLSSLLDTLEARECRILRLRYGVDGGSNISLQEIADQEALTRSRVQQIEARALRKLQGRIIQHEVLGAFVWLCKEAIITARITSASTLVAELCEYLAPNNHLNRGQIRLLVEGIGELARYQEDLDLFAHALTRLEVHSALRKIRRALRIAGAPIRFSDLVSLMQQGSPTSEQVDVNLVRALLQAVPDFINVEEDFWGLESWEGHINDDLVVVLRKLGRPAHFSELAREVNGRLPADARKSERNVLAHLQRLTNLFARTGPGTFALRENHSDLPSQPIKYVDLIEQVLQEIGSPLQVDEVFGLVNERREAKKSSIQMYLSMDSRFVKLGPARYGLSTWRDASQVPSSTHGADAREVRADDFTDELTQRVQQWLEHNPQ